jgi:purine-nucleoside phosphorylase
VTGTYEDRKTLAEAAAAALAEKTGAEKHDIAVVLGSGWRPAADEIGTADHEVPVGDLPGFLAPTVTGHGGTIRSLTVGDKRVMVMLGRTHYYEGHGVAQVVHGVRTAAAAGCGTVILTNAAGGMRAEYEVGQPVLISDHINMTAQSPLVGAEFMDLTDLYAKRLRDVARGIDASLQEGVYVGLTGPHFETPAEIRMFTAMGGDLVGMSTVLEAIAARAAGVEVFGLSLVTNLAAGITGEPLNHLEVLAAGQRSATRMGRLLRELVAQA